MPKPRRARRVHVNKLPAEEIARRCRIITQQLSPYGVTASGVAHLVKSCRFTPEKLSTRLGQMRRAGVPLTGLVYKLARSEAKFGQLLERYSEKGGLTERQLELKNFLLSQKVSPGVISGLLGRSRKGGKLFDVAGMRAKINFFKSIPLDPRVYGVRIIPVGYFEKMLVIRPSEIQKGIKVRVLWPLEDAHAAKQLDGLRPGWRSSKKLRRLRPANLLAKANEALAQGISPTVYLLFNYSLESIRAGKAKTGQYVAKGREPKLSRAEKRAAGAVTRARGNRARNREAANTWLEAARDQQLIKSKTQEKFLRLIINGNIKLDPQEFKRNVLPRLQGILDRAMMD